MDKEEITLSKLALLVEATSQLREQDSVLEEVKTAAFEALLLNPGSDFGDWEQILVKEYATEVIDANGENSEEVYEALSDLWETPYEDIASGLEYDFKDWAEAFATDESVRMYYDMIDKLKM